MSDVTSTSGDDDAVSALDERGQPPPELGGGGLRRELEAMYAVVRADAIARLRWLDRAGASELGAPLSAEVTQIRT